MARLSGNKEEKLIFSAGRSMDNNNIKINNKFLPFGGACRVRNKRVNLSHMLYLTIYKYVLIIDLTMQRPMKHHLYISNMC